MPYDRNAELPESVKGKLPDSAQSTWRRAFNSAYEQYKEDGQAAAVAWAALQSAGWRKEGGNWVKKELTIAKTVPDENLVFGWAYVSIRKDGQVVLDHSDEVIDIEDLEFAAYAFNLQFRETGEMHKGEAVGELVESFMITPAKIEAMGLAKDALPCGWWLGFYIENDEVFEKVKKGEYAMFSIQGIATREEA